MSRARQGKRVRRVCLWAALSLLAPLLSAFASADAATSDRGFCAYRLARSGDATQAELDSVLASVAGESPSPDDIVVLIHGWDTPRYQSDKLYAAMATEIRLQFAKQHSRACVVGVQWDSDAGPRRAWMPQVFFHYLFGVVGFPKAVQHPYTSAVPRARAAGRAGVRRLLFALRDRFPSAHVHIFAHSMGAEVTIHALHPDTTPVPAGAASAVYLPEGEVRADLVVLAGADLDEDIAMSCAGRSTEQHPQLVWVTLPEPGGRRDRVLNYRKLARHKTALGNALPQLRREQLDAVIGARRLVFDTHAIPRGHQIWNYYNAERIDRLVGAAVALREPSGDHSPLLKDLAGVLAAPSDVAALRPYLSSAEVSVRLYALWRFERLVCGDSRHLVDGYSRKMLDMALHHPAEFVNEQSASTCAVIRTGLWPPRDLLRTPDSLTVMPR